MKFGLIPEFVGRLPVIATLDDLDQSALIEILKTPKNALVKQYQSLFEMEDIKLGFSDGALESIAEKAIEDIGYTTQELGATDTSSKNKHFSIEHNIVSQSPHIAQGVNVFEDHE